MQRLERLNPMTVCKLFDRFFNLRISTAPRRNLSKFEMEFSVEKVVSDSMNLFVGLEIWVIEIEMGASTESY